MKKQTLRELRRIQESIPEAMKKRLIRKEKLTPNMKKVMDEALISESVPEQKKKQIQHLMDAGYFDREHEVVNKTAQKEIDKYVNTEIAKSIVAGRLPQPKNKMFNRYINKIKKYENRRSGN